MATVDKDHPIDGAPSPRDQIAEEAGLKRKASPDHQQEESPKRTKHDQDDPDATNDGFRRGSSSSVRERRGPPSHAEVDRRRSATQEEKKRGKRLFGGLLNTLSQTAGNTQQKRRHEIEQRQQERLRKQNDEDDRKRAEKATHVRKIRMAEQIVFEEEVMLRRHSNMLATARFLQTKSEPRIYYLPWKLSTRQEDELEDQIRDAQTRIDKELASFQARKERHIKEHGPSKRLTKAKESLASTTEIADSPPRKGQVVDDQETEQPKKTPEKQPEEEPPTDHDHHHRDHHDEADVVEEADEDMVIY